MKKLMQRMISIGADFSTRKALKSTLRYLGIKPENIDRLYVELKNDFYRETFKAIPPQDKIVFLPQCLRSRNCKATLTKQEGFICNGCNKKGCSVYKIKTNAESKGYRVFISPGGSMVVKLIKKHKPKAILGVACMKEIVMAIEVLNIPAQAIELSKDGCYNTDVKISKVLDIL